MEGNRVDHCPSTLMTITSASTAPSTSSITPMISTTSVASTSSANFTTLLRNAKEAGKLKTEYVYVVDEGLDVPRVGTGFSLVKKGPRETVSRVLEASRSEGEEERAGVPVTKGKESKKEKAKGEIKKGSVPHPVGERGLEAIVRWMMTKEQTENQITYWKQFREQVGIHPFIHSYICS